jgi:hypothetical protein
MLKIICVARATVALESANSVLAPTEYEKN